MKPLSDAINESIFSKIKNYGIVTGFHALDSIIEGGLKPGSVTVVSGQSGIGHTSFGVSVAISAALNQEAVVTYFSAEQNEEDIGPLFYGILKDFSKDLFLSKSLSTRALLHLKSEAAPLLNSAVFIDEGKASEIISIFLNAKERDADLLVLDDFLSAEEKMNSDFLKTVKDLSRIANIATLITMSMEIPRADKRPTREDILNIVNSNGVDICVLLHRESFYDTEISNPSIGEVIVVKNNLGPCETVPLIWDKACSKWFNSHLAML